MTQSHYSPGLFDSSKCFIRSSVGFKPAAMLSTSMFIASSTTSSNALKASPIEFICFFDYFFNCIEEITNGFCHFFNFHLFNLFDDLSTACNEFPADSTISLAASITASNKSLTVASIKSLQNRASSRACLKNRMMDDTYRFVLYHRTL